MEREGLKRKLAAILCADVAGYSRLMGADEEGTLIALKALRASLIDPKIAEHDGRIVKTMGDGVLVEFASAVDAVRCALDVQHGMAERNGDVPDERRIDFRVGINVGDVIHENDDIFGDGVNVAARVQTLAEPGGICLTESAFQQVSGKIALNARDLGERELKNIAKPVRIYGVGTERAVPRPALALPDKPSLAVLPFANLSGDPEQEYFADGMAEEIITALSRYGWLFVIARNSSFTYKGKAVDVRQVGRELGVRYVLEGSVRRGGNRLRFIAQLIEAASGTHIWADRFEGETSDVFALQDRITENVVGAIEPSLQLAEIGRLKQKPAANLDAYDLLLRAQQYEYQFTKESLAQAVQCVEQALAIDTAYAQAMALAGFCYTWRVSQGWADDLGAETAEGLRLAWRAIEIENNDPNVLWMSGFAIWSLASDAKRSAELFSRSLAANPNSAIALTNYALTEAYLGHTDKAIEMVARARRLSPRDPRDWLMSLVMTMACNVAGRYEECVTWAERVLVQNPRSTSALRLMAGALAALGERDKAREVVARMLKIDPGMTISALRERLPFVSANESYWQRYREQLRDAGVPE